MKICRQLPRRLGRAFTLIEIMIVVAILGLVLAMGIPSIIRALEKEGMRKAVGDLLEACKVARRNAILDAKPVDLVFHPIDRTFEVADFHAKFPDNITIDILGVNFIQLEATDLAKVRFYPNGTCEEFTIVIHSDQQETRKIQMDIVTALPE